jgi:hypothetical protein
MPELTVKKTDTADGYSFVRSDGERFFMICREDGSASLYAGASPDKPPQIGLRDFDVSVQDKVAAATGVILAYTKKPGG